MALLIVGIVLTMFSVFLYLTAQKDFHENPWDFTPFEDEAMMILVAQKVASAIMDVMYLATLFLGVMLIVKGFTSL